VKSPDNGNQLDESIAIVHKIIDEEVANGTPANRIVVGGFSQGGALSLCCAIRYPHTLGGCCVLSGWAPPKQELHALLAASSTKTPFLVCHGDSDQVVLYENAVFVNKMLVEAGNEDYCNTL
jgi:predicted esterase